MKNYSPIIDGKDVVTKEFVESISGNEYFSTIPIGCVIANASNTVYNGFLLCDGTSYLVEEYPELYEIIGNKYGGDANNFNVPNLVDKFIQGDNTSGTEKDAGLPNIVGTMGAVVTGGGYDTQNSGALYWKENVETAQTWGTSNGYRTSYGLDASLSNSIYGNSDTVQPPALTMIYIIKAKHTNEGTDVNVELTDEVINQINLTVDKKTENLEIKIGNPKNLETEDKSSLVNAINEVKASAGSGSASLPIGVIMPIATPVVPEKWLLCDGSEISRETYSDLFNAIGGIYGVGDGSTTFNLPDMRFRVPVGVTEDTAIIYSKATATATYVRVDITDDLLAYEIGDIVEYNGETRNITAKTISTSYIQFTLESSFGIVIEADAKIILRKKFGSTGGERTHKLTVSEMPSHTHTAYVYNKNKSGIETGSQSNGVENATTSATGGSQAHNNMPPYITMNYIIYAGV